jgi:hypothetical protein
MDLVYPPSEVTLESDEVDPWAQPLYLWKGCLDGKKHGVGKGRSIVKYVKRGSKKRRRIWVSWKKICMKDDRQDG